MDTLDMILIDKDFASQFVLRRPCGVSTVCKVARLLRAQARGPLVRRLDKYAL